MRPAPGSSLRLVLLATAGAVEGVLLAHGPLLDQYAAVRLGPRGVFVDITLLSALLLGALGALAALSARVQAVFLTLLAGTITWSLANASLHPWWVLDEDHEWIPEAASFALLAVHVAVLLAVASAVLLAALDRYREAARAQGVPPAQLRLEVRRLATAGFTMLALASVPALVLPQALQAFAGGVHGVLDGATAFAVLLAAILLLLVGLGLLLSQATARQKERPTRVVESGDGET